MVVNIFYLLVLSPIILKTFSNRSCPLFIISNQLSYCDHHLYERYYETQRIPFNARLNLTIFTVAQIN